MSDTETTRRIITSAWHRRPLGWDWDKRPIMKMTVNEPQAVVDFREATEPSNETIDIIRFTLRKSRPEYCFVKNPQAPLLIEVVGRLRGVECVVDSGLEYLEQNRTKTKRERGKQWGN